jgi:hypothetical protein
MIPEAPFFFVMGTMSLALAGLAGLVAALRRGETMRSIDLFRLREIVEFAFANALLAVSTVPLAVVLGAPAATRIIAFAAILYLIVVSAYLFRRLRRSGNTVRAPWVAVAAVLDGFAIIAALSAAVLGAVAALEATLVLFLARPMTAFLFVLESFEERQPA